MIIYLLIGIAAVLFIGGTWVLFKGIQNSKEELKVVPISDLKEIKDLQKKDKSSVPSTATSSLSQHVIAENTKRSFGSPFDAPVLIKDLQNKVEQLRAENLRLTNALRQEVDSKDMSTLSVVERDKLQEKTEQLKMANERIQNLSADYHQLKNKFDEKVSAYEAIQIKLNEKNEEYARLAEAQMGSSKELHDEINKLKGQNESLNRASQELSFQVQQKGNMQEMANEQKNLVIALEKQISDLRNNNHDWQLKLDAEIGKWRKENEALMRCLKEEESKSKDLVSAFKSLSKKYEDTVNLHTHSSDEQMSFLGEQLSKITIERDGYKMKVDLWEPEMEKLRALNSHLMEKEKMLQYELTKSRAQALGLERICEDFKLLLENNA